MKYRKIPVVIEAMKFTGSFDNYDEICEWSKEKFPINTLFMYGKMVKELFIQTLEGRMRADIGDYIIKGVKGEFYPIKEEIFHETYEQVEE